jgi:NAD(P)H-nitrite reductase large subunit
MDHARAPVFNYVLIGSGPAGIAAVEVIRSQDRRGRILIISDEASGYYSRPGLAYYLTGEIPEDSLYPFTQKDFQRLDVQRLHTRVLRIQTGSRCLELGNGQSVGYERLLIATGASAALLDVEGLDAEGVVKLDNLDDARRILKLARKARSAVVTGGGITALEVVEGLIANRVKVHYFLRGDRYWSGVLDETESRIVERRLKEEGVQIHYHTELSSILTNRGKVVGICTKDGRQISCSIVGIAIGIRPRKELAAAAGLEVDRGILVDEYMQTSDPNIFAAGDVAQVFDPFTGKSLLDSLWTPAREQGRAAGWSMLAWPGAGNVGQAEDLRKPYLRTVPFNVTRLANLTTTIIGQVGNGDDSDLIGIARGDSETWRHLPDAIAAQSNFEVNRLRLLVGEKKLMGAIIMGDQTLSQPLRRMITSEVDITPIRNELLVAGAAVADIIADYWSKIVKDGFQNGHKESLSKS